MKHKQHRTIDKVFLGKEYPGVHRFIDRPYRVYGRRHRAFFHDLDTVLLLSALDPRYGLSCLLHIIADRVDTYNKKRGRRKWL